VADADTQRFAVNSDLYLPAKTFSRKQCHGGYSFYTKEGGRVWATNGFEPYVRPVQADAALWRSQTQTLAATEAIVRFAGRISGWNDEKGFGFVEPNGGGERAFVHINEFQRRSRRPVDGDLISYLPVKDARGRLQAREVRHAGQRIAPQRQPSTLPRTAIGICALVIVAVATAIGLLPLMLAGLYFLASGISYFIYRSDKQAAAANDQRTPESQLHLAGLLGGWPGALIAQQEFRHKTIKQPFQTVFWITVALNLAGVVWLVSSGVASRLIQSLMH
jgi:uncharacterized membrane protein YsdA (DUF1294 family)/cold shock CspA family protein